MKKLLFILPLAASGFVNAQPVINETDVFITSTSCQYGYMFNPNISAGNPGTAQNYSMTGVSPDWTLDQQVESIANSPFGAALPGNRVLLYNQGADGAAYLTRSVGVLNMNGTVVPDATNPNLLYVERYMPPLHVATFPMTYMQADSGTSLHQITFYVGMDLGQGWVTDSMRRRTTEIYSYEFDGWGTMTTPAGNYTVLRQKIVTQTYDTVDYYRSDINMWLTAFETLESYDHTYRFWGAGVSFPVAEMLDIDGDGFIEDCIWLMSTSTTGMENNAAANSAIEVFPNPSEGLVTLKNQDGDNAAWLLTDMTGKTLCSGRMSGNQETFDFSMYPAGIYFLQVETRNGTVSKRIVTQ